MNDDILLAEDAEHVDEARTEAVDAGLGYGRLDPVVRQALLELLARGVVRFKRKPEAYNALRAYYDEVATLLADLELKLDHDGDAKTLVLCRQVNEDEDVEERNRLIRRRPLSEFDTRVAIVLRRHYLQRENAGDAEVLIDAATIEEELLPMLPSSNSESLRRKHLNGSLAHFKELNILEPVRGTEDRFEISPAIKLVIKRDILDGIHAAWIADAERHSKEST